MTGFIKQVDKCELVEFRRFVVRNVDAGIRLQFVKHSTLKCDEDLQNGKVFVGRILLDPVKLSKMMYNFWRLVVEDLSDKSRPEVKVWVQEGFVDFHFHKGDFFAVTNGRIASPTPSSPSVGIIVREKHQSRIWVITTHAIDKRIQSTLPDLILDSSTASSCISSALPDNSCCPKVRDTPFCDRSTSVSPNLPRSDPVTSAGEEMLQSQKSTEMVSESRGLPSPRSVQNKQTDPRDAAKSQNSVRAPTMHMALPSRENERQLQAQKSTEMASESRGLSSPRSGQSIQTGPRDSTKSQNSATAPTTQNSSPSRENERQHVLLPAAQAVPLKPAAQAVPQHAIQKNDPIITYEYTKIKLLKEGIFNVYGVVMEVKPVSISLKGAPFVTVYVADESTSTKLVVTIFTKDPACLPQINYNDVIRFHRLKVDSKSNNFFGKLQSEKDFCVWSAPDYGQKAPKTAAKTYSFTLDDEAEVHRLSMWISSKDSSLVSKAATVSFINEPTTAIKDLHSGYFNLMCQVVDSFQPVATSEDPFVLRVWDNTLPFLPSVIWDPPPDHHNSDMFLDLQEFVIEVAVYDANYADVAKKLKPGDVIVMVNLHVKVYKANAIYPDPKSAFYMHPGGQLFRRCIRIAEGHQRETFFAMLKEAHEQKKSANVTARQPVVSSSPSKVNKVGCSSQDSGAAQKNGAVVYHENPGDKDTLPEVPAKRARLDVVIEDGSMNESFVSTASSSFITMDLDDSQGFLNNGSGNTTPLSKCISHHRVGGFPSLQLAKPGDNISGVFPLSSPNASSTPAAKKFLSLSKVSERPIVITDAKKHIAVDTQVNVCRDKPSCEIMFPIDDNSMDLDSLILEMGESSSEDGDKTVQPENEITFVSESESEDTCSVAKKKDGNALEPFQTSVLDSDNDSDSRFYYERSVTLTSEIDVCDPLSSCHPKGTTSVPDCIDLVSSSESTKYTVVSLPQDDSSCEEALVAKEVDGSSLCNTCSASASESLQLKSQTPRKTVTKAVDGSAVRNTRSASTSKSLQLKSTTPRKTTRLRLKADSLNLAVVASCAASTSGIKNILTTGSDSLHLSTEDDPVEIQSADCSSPRIPKHRTYTLTEFRSYKTDLLNTALKLPVTPIGELHSTSEGENVLIEAKVLSYSPTLEDPNNLVHLYCARCNKHERVDKLNFETRGYEEKDCADCLGQPMEPIYYNRLKVCDETGLLGLCLCKDAAVIFFQGKTPRQYLKSADIQRTCRGLLKQLCPYPEQKSWKGCRNPVHKICVKWIGSGRRRQYYYLTHIAIE